MNHRKFIYMFILLGLSGNLSAGVDDVKFVKDPPSGCKKMGQVVGFFDRKIYDDWSNWGKGRYYKVVSNPDFLQTMKRQALKMQGNRIVITNSRVDYSWKQYKSGIIEYHFKTNTYTGIAYKCKQ
ncbi:MAG: DUF4156 domain-containing protein [Gammaproteobacteria bacterium]|nr:DUF4156 domain-containing protein [Gammaproteobacteria bacterium]